MNNFFMPFTLSDDFYAGHITVSGNVVKINNYCGPIRSDGECSIISIFEFTLFDFYTWFNVMLKALVRYSNGDMRGKPLVRFQGCNLEFDPAIGLQIMLGSADRKQASQNWFKMEIVGQQWDSKNIDVVISTMELVVRQLQQRLSQPIKPSMPKVTIPPPSANINR